ncbi:MAG TPA: glycoside hydrolase family 43 protein [Streptosporangiaceae bacterium]|nr:glycoside hydrolase family 43 protein [Streptosporangiaceae bacterium]
MAIVRGRVAGIAVAVAGATALLTSMITSGGPAAANAQAPAVASASAAKTFSNPVLGPGQDPSVLTYHGWYYFTQLSPDGKNITIRQARSIKSLAAAPKTTVWTGGRSGSPCCDWWAPELHHINGAWYIYTTADDGNNDNHRLQVLQASDPLGPYTYRGQLTTPGGDWSIDPSPLQLPNGQLYLAWSGWPGRTNGVQNIYLAKLANPWTITGDRTLLSTPTYSWETQAGTVGVLVNESPEPIVHGNKVFITYSASGCWTPDYALGLLSASTHANLLNASSWTKSATPVFHSNTAAGIYAPASNGWFTSPDGKQTWMVFHAVNDSAGNCGLERAVYAQPVTWGANGFPQLGGEPVSLTTTLRVPSGDPGAP